MLILFYLAFLTLVLGFIWFVTGLLILITNILKKGDKKIALKMVLLSLAILVISVLTIFLTDKYLSAHADPSAQDVYVYEYETASP